MNSHSTPRFVTFGLILLTPAFAGGPAGGPFEVARSNIDGGGGMNLAGGSFELAATVGQPTAGALAGGTITLSGGFWVESPAGDCELDGDVDLNDFASLESCMTGPDVAVQPGCRCFDIDGSGTIDLGDFARSQTAHTSSP